MQTQAAPAADRLDVERPAAGPCRFRRIAVIGTSGAGKTTLAGELSRRLGLPHVELDALRHGPNWVETPDDLFRERVAEQARGDAWVIDGNYGFARDLVWSRAELLVWLDYSLPVVMARVLWRTFARVVTREELWNGNRESLRLALSRDSVIAWAYTTHRRRHHQIPEVLARPEYAHLAVVRLPTPAAAKVWLEQIRLTRGPFSSARTQC